MNISKSVMPLVAAASVLLTACGGGGGGGDGGGDAFSSMRHDVRPDGRIQADAGASLQITAQTRSKSEITAMSWQVMTEDGAQLDARMPVVADKDCAMASSRREGVEWVGTCTTTLIIPSQAETRNWRIRSTARNQAGETGADDFIAEVKAKPFTDVGISLNMPATPIFVDRGELVTLYSALVTDPVRDVTDVRLTWTQKSGPADVAMVGRKGLTPTFRAMLEGEYLFELTATARVNGRDVSVSGDTVVLADEPVVLEITANAPAEVMPGAAVSLQGLAQASSDAGTPRLEYLWEQVSGPELATELDEATEGEGVSPEAYEQAQVSLLNPQSAIASFIAPQHPGTYIFQLTVTAQLNGRVWNRMTQVRIQVTDATGQAGGDEADTLPEA